MLWPGFALQNNNIYVLKQYMKDYKEQHLTHTEPERNPFSPPKNTTKPYFATRCKRIFTKSTAQTTKPHCRQEKSFRPHVGQNRGEEGGKHVYTAQVHNLVTKLLCPGFETKLGKK